MTLQAHDLAKTYRCNGSVVRALDGVSITASAGEFVAVRGPSGCGKSTLLLACGGSLAPDAGSVLPDGQDLRALRPEARAKVRAAGIGLVFQRFHLVPYLSLLDNVLAAAIAAPADDAPRRGQELVERFGLAERRDHRPSELNTGQRLALARAMLNRPWLLLADEPRGDLDPANGQVVLEALADHARAGNAVLLVTHDPAATALASRTLHMERGQRRAVQARARRVPGAGRRNAAPRPSGPLLRCLLRNIAGPGRTAAPPGLCGSAPRPSAG